jgi:hypothetical protein
MEIESFMRQRHVPQHGDAEKRSAGRHVGDMNITSLQYFPIPRRLEFIDSLQLN